MVESHEPAPDHTGEEPTERQPARWTGSAPVPVPVPDEKRRWRGALREPTAELPTVDEPWPSPPPPRPANAPVTAPYPPPAPPGWHPPPRPPSGGRPYPPPPYRRRRRRWPWVLGTFGLIVAVCCGCCFSIFKPFIDQYPATATLPAQAVGLVQLTDATSVAAAATRERWVRSRHWLADNVFAAVYAEPRSGQRPVTIFGATMLVFDPERDLKNEFAALAGELSPTDIRAVEPGPAGGHQRCADGRRAGTSVTICGWADHGSIAVAIISGRSIDDSAQLLRELRAEIISRT